MLKIKNVKDEGNCLISLPYGGGQARAHIISFDAWNTQKGKWERVNETKSDFDEKINKKVFIRIS